MTKEEVQKMAENGGKGFWFKFLGGIATAVAVPVLVGGAGVVREVARIEARLDATEQIVDGRFKAMATIIEIHKDREMHAGARDQFKIVEQDLRGLQISNERILSNLDNITTLLKARDVGH